MRTADEVRIDFLRKGITINGWAKKNGFKPQAVRRVIGGESKCLYGNAHKIAVMLGIKDGEIVCD